MFVKRLIITVAVSLIAVSTYAQKNDFCDAVSAILKDAPNQFRNIRNPNPEKGGQNSITYKSGINIPGTIISRFISSMGFFYEGALKQAKTPEGLKDDYEHYKTILNTCLESKGYKMRLTPNYITGLENYKKVIFMPDFKASATPPIGHVALEVDFNKTSGMYTLIIYIFEK